MTSSMCTIYPRPKKCLFIHNWPNLVHPEGPHLEGRRPETSRARGETRSWCWSVALARVHLDGLTKSFYLMVFFKLLKKSPLRQTFLTSNLCQTSYKMMCCNFPTIFKSLNSPVPLKTYISFVTWKKKSFSKGPTLFFCCCCCRYFFFHGLRLLCKYGAIYIRLLHQYRDCTVPFAGVALERDMGS